MKKSEYIEKVNEIYSKLEDIETDVDAVKNNITRLVSKMEDLPTEPNEIEDDNEDE